MGEKLSLYGIVLYMSCRIKQYLTIKLERIVFFPLRVFSAQRIFL